MLSSRIIRLGLPRQIVVVIAEDLSGLVDDPNLRLHVSGILNAGKRKLGVPYTSWSSESAGRGTYCTGFRLYNTCDCEFIQV